MKKLSLVLVFCLLVTIMPVSVYAVNDQDYSDWAEETIDFIKSKSLVDERLLSNYTSSMTRSEFAYLAVVLYENLTNTKSTVGDASFTDTNDTYVLKAKNHNLVSGYPDGSYKPDNQMTRAEIAKLFINILKASNISVDVKYAKVFNDDYLIPNWAKESIYIAQAFNIVNGVGGNKFAPDGKATREQALAMFLRIYRKYITSGETSGVLKILKVGDKVPNFL